MIINHNMMSMNAQRSLGVNSSGLGKSIEKLSTGQRVNRAADDAAGLGRPWHGVRIAPDDGHRF